MLYPVFLALLSIIACATSSQLQPRAPCDDSHFLCYPPEGEEWDPPLINKGIRNLLKDLRKSVENPWDKPRDQKRAGGSLVGRAPSDDPLCCFLGDGCYSLRKRRAPFCYNPFNTDFRIAGGFTGNLNTGRYETPDGDRANLYHGNFILADGTIGNIYHHGHSPADKGLDTIGFPALTTPSRVTPTPVVETQVLTLDGTTIPARTFYPGDWFPALMDGRSVILPEATFTPVIAEGTTIPQRVITTVRPLTILGEPIIGSG